MSGGHFSPCPSKLREISEEILFIVENRKDMDGSPMGEDFTPELVAILEEVSLLCRETASKLSLVDKLFSCDVGPETFLDRWKILNRGPR